MATTSSSVRSDSGQISKHLCEYGLTIKPKNRISQGRNWSQNKRPRQNFFQPFFFWFYFSIVMFYDVTGEPQGQWSVHLSDQRLQTNRAQSQPHCQRSVARRKVAKCEREICLSPSLNIITRGANWELRGLGPQDKLTSTMLREFRHPPLNVSQFPSVQSSDQTAFKLSSSHLSLNTVS